MRIILWKTKSLQKEELNIIDSLEASNDTVKSLEDIRKDDERITNQLVQVSIDVLYLEKSRRPGSGCLCYDYSTWYTWANWVAKYSCVQCREENVLFAFCWHFERIGVSLEMGR